MGSMIQNEISDIKDASIKASQDNWTSEKGIVSIWCASLDLNLKWTSNEK
jgi:hypothetical protein